jgi:hypothetical protein
MFGRYISMLYYGILNIELNEFGPVNKIEFYYVIITCVLSAFYKAFLFGDISSLITTL